MQLLPKLSAILESPRVYLAYQWLVGGTRARHKCIREYVRPGPGLVVLDIGCGPAYTFADFPRPIYYGFDVSPEYVAWARRKYPQGHFYCREFDESAVESLPKADVVLMMGLLHHLDDGPARALLQLGKRALKKGAYVLTLDAYYGPGQSRITRFFLDGDRGRFIRRQRGYEELVGSVFNDVRVFLRDDLFIIPLSFDRPSVPRVKEAGRKAGRLPRSPLGVSAPPEKLIPVPVVDFDPTSSRRQSRCRGRSDYKAPPRVSLPLRVSLPRSQR